MACPNENISYFGRLNILKIMALTEMWLPEKNLNDTSNSCFYWTAHFSETRASIMPRLRPVLHVHDEAMAADSLPAKSWPG